jgi:hypothetical protein
VLHPTLVIQKRNKPAPTKPESRHRKRNSHQLSQHPREIQHSQVEKPIKSSYLSFYSNIDNRLATLQTSEGTNELQ